MRLTLGPAVSNLKSTLQTNILVSPNALYSVESLLTASNPSSYSVDTVKRKVLYSVERTWHKSGKVFELCLSSPRSTKIIFATKLAFLV